MPFPHAAPFVLVLLSAPAPDAPAPPRPRPVSAHNCYDPEGAGRGRLDEALALGVDNIEIDVGWDAAGKRLIVGHDASPSPGATYAEFEDYLVPAIEAHWRKPRPDGAPTVLTVDWKTDHPDAVTRFKAFLDAHPDWFSSAPKRDGGSPLTTRRLTVCLTGSDRAKERYDALVPPGNDYRAFRDNVVGAGDPYREDVAAYVPHRSTAFHRFLTIAWGHVERGGPPLAGDWTDVEADRLKALTDLAHRRGFRVRVYCLNGHTGPRVSPYRFRDDATARVRWRASSEAGVDWIASDEYDVIIHELGPPPTIKANSGNPGKPR